MPMSRGTKKPRARYKAPTIARRASTLTARYRRESLNGAAVPASAPASSITAGSAAPMRLFLDAHFVVDPAHAFHLAGEGERLVDLQLAVDEAAQLHGAGARDDGDVEAFHAWIGQQRRLHLGGDDA